MISFAYGNTAMHTKIYRQPIIPRPKQKGAATLVMSLVLLTLITMVSVYTSRTVLMEQKISANDFRERQAFEAAESGLATAISYVSGTGGADKDGDGTVDPVFDTDGDGIGDSNNLTFSDFSSVTVTITGALPTFLLQSIGVSDDLTATRTVRSIGTPVDALPNSPGGPMTTRGTVSAVGSATIYNPEGNTTIWSGGDVDLGANNSTATNIADPSDPGYPSCMETSMTCGTTRSSSKVAVGLDVLEYDTTLSNLTTEQMFQNFFGTSMANYRESRVTLEVMAANVDNNATNTASPGVHLAVGEVIWVEGNASIGSTTVGCEITLTGAATCPTANLDPSVLIINGHLDTSGGKFYGVVFVIGDVTVSGSAVVTGAIIVGNNSHTTAGGSLDLWYNSDVMNMTRDNGLLGGTPGSWRDW